MGEDRNVGVLGVVDPPVHPGRASPQAACLTSLLIPWLKPLTLLELGKRGALNSSPQPSTGSQWVKSTKSHFLPALSRQ